MPCFPPCDLPNTAGSSKCFYLGSFCFWIPPPENSNWGQGGGWRTGLDLLLGESSVISLSLRFLWSIQGNSIPGEAPLAAALTWIPSLFSFHLCPLQQQQPVQTVQKSWNFRCLFQGCELAQFIQLQGTLLESPALVSKFLSFFGEG